MFLAVHLKTKEIPECAQVRGMIFQVFPVPPSCTLAVVFLESTLFIEDSNNFTFYRKLKGIIKCTIPKKYIISISEYGTSAPVWINAEYEPDLENAILEGNL